MMSFSSGTCEQICHTTFVTFSKASVVLPLDFPILHLTLLITKGLSNQRCIEWFLYWQAEYIIILTDQMTSWIQHYWLRMRSKFPASTNNSDVSDAVSGCFICSCHTDLQVITRARITLIKKCLHSNQIIQQNKVCIKFSTLILKAPLTFAFVQDFMWQYNIWRIPGFQHLPA